MNNKLAQAPIGHSSERKVQPEDLISDWYIFEEDIEMSFVYPGPLPVVQASLLLEGANYLLKQCVEKTKNGYEEFVANFRGRNFRGHRIGSSVSGAVYALRKMPEHIPSLKDLGLSEALQQVLMDKHLNKGGLIMICGETGQGKSTTCASAIKERMLLHGAFCLTVEDPPEMPLNGAHRMGRCIQTEAKSGNFSEAMKGAMRCYPSRSGSILYVGETRDPETAAECLRAAMNGHLVFTTTHSSGVVTGLKRMVSLAKGPIGSLEETRSMLASTLRVVMHQRLVEKEGVGGQSSKKQVEVEFLLSPSGQSGIANKIRGSSEEMLGTDIQQQRMILNAKGTAALLDVWNKEAK